MRSPICVGRYTLNPITASKPEQGLYKPQYLLQSIGGCALESQQLDADAM